MRGLRRRFQQRRRPVTGPLLRFVDKSQIHVLAPHDALQRRDHAKAINANGLFAALYRACVTGARLSATWTNASQCKRGNERDCSTSAGACTAMLRVLDDARVSSLLGSRGPRVALGFSCKHHISVSSHVHRAASSVRSSEKRPVSKYCLKLSSSSSSSSSSLGVDSCNRNMRRTLRVAVSLQLSMTKMTPMTIPNEASSVT
jgi:hypothetical protein